MAQGWHYGGLIGKTPTRGGTLGGSATNIATSGVYTPGGFSPDLNTNTVPTSQADDVDAWIKATYLPANATIQEIKPNTSLNNSSVGVDVSTTNTDLAVKVFDSSASSNQGSLGTGTVSGAPAMEMRNMNKNTAPTYPDNAGNTTVGGVAFSWFAPQSEMREIAAQAIPSSHYSTMTSQTTDEAAVWMIYRAGFTQYGTRGGDLYNGITTPSIPYSSYGGAALGLKYFIYRLASTGTVYLVTVALPSQPYGPDANGNYWYIHGLTNVTSSVAAYSSTKNVQVPGKSLQRWGGLVGRSIYTDDPVTLRSTGIITTPEAYQLKL